MADQRYHRNDGLAPTGFSSPGRVVLAMLCVAGFAAATGYMWLSLLICLIGGGMWVTLLNLRFQTVIGETDAKHRKVQAEAEGWKRKLDALHAETRQNATALLNLTDGVIVLSSDLHVLLINPSAADLLGIQSREGLLGRPIAEIARLPELLQAIRIAVAEKQPQEVLVEVALDNEVRPLRVRVNLIDTGQAANLQLSIRDETEARHLEQVRREFIANVSHELKTPLAAIKGYAETVELAISDDPDAAEHFLSQIHTQCSRLERLINDMMQLARAQAGRDKLNLVSVVLPDLIQESASTYLPVAEAGDVQLAVEALDDNAKVIADREATLTIVNNLIGNAVRYTPPGGSVHVRIRPEETSWAIVVEDTGIGIEADEQSRIFERFYRGRKNSRDTKGTGLGLAIVKNLSQAQGGEVRVASQPGQGATFWVTLPAVQFTNVPETEPVQA
ncbi:MAG: ATP-binding protein [Planctomycetota bacterium]